MGASPSLSPFLCSPSTLSGSACLRALLLVLTEHPLIVGISPACLAKVGEGDLRLLLVFGAPLEPDASCFYPHQERACFPQGLPTAIGSHNNPGRVRTATAHSHTLTHTPSPGNTHSSYNIQKTKYSQYINTNAKKKKSRGRDKATPPTRAPTSVSLTFQNKLLNCDELILIILGLILNFATICFSIFQRIKLLLLPRKPTKRLHEEVLFYGYIPALH